VTPPKALTLPCERPVRSIETTRDLVEHRTDLIEALDICAGRLDRIREWADANTEAPE